MSLITSWTTYGICSTTKNRASWESNLVPHATDHALPPTDLVRLTDKLAVSIFKNNPIEQNRIIFSILNDFFKKNWVFCQCKHFSNWRISLEKLISFIKAGTFFEIRNNFSQNGNIFWNSKRKLVKRKHSLNSRPKFEKANNFLKFVIFWKFVNIFLKVHERLWIHGLIDILQKKNLFLIFMIFLNLWILLN